MTGALGAGASGRLRVRHGGRNVRISKLAQRKLAMIAPNSRVAAVC